MPAQYDLYRGETSVWDIDYADSIGAVAAGNGSITSDALDWGRNKTWWVGLRATSATGIQERNTHVIAKFQTDAIGNLVADLPNLIFGLHATSDGGDVTVRWSYESEDEIAAPTDFRIYRGTSRDSLSAIGTTVYVARVKHFSYLDSGLASGTYFYQVRPRNSNGDELIGGEVAMVVVDATAPAGVSDLVVA